MTEELFAKLRSKEDFYIYMDKHCKYPIIHHWHFYSVVLYATNGPDEQGLSPGCPWGQEEALQEEIGRLYRRPSLVGAVG